MTQKELAEILGCSQQFISKWKNGIRGLKLTTALKWAAKLDIDKDILIYAPKNPKIRATILGIKK